MCVRVDVRWCVSGQLPASILINKLLSQRQSLLSQTRPTSDMRGSSSNMPTINSNGPDNGGWVAAAMRVFHNRLLILFSQLMVVLLCSRIRCSTASVPAPCRRSFALIPSQSESTTKSRVTSIRNRVVDSRPTGIPTPDTTASRAPPQ